MQLMQLQLGLDCPTCVQMHIRRLNSKKNVRFHVDPGKGIYIMEDLLVDHALAHGHDWFELRPRLFRVLPQVVV